MSGTLGVSVWENVNRGLLKNEERQATGVCVQYCELWIGLECWRPSIRRRFAVWIHFFYRRWQAILAGLRNIQFVIPSKPSARQSPKGHNLISGGGAKKSGITSHAQSESVESGGRIGDTQAGTPKRGKSGPRLQR